jgi:hypothetical protein
MALTEAKWARSRSFARFHIALIGWHDQDFRPMLSVLLGFAASADLPAIIERLSLPSSSDGWLPFGSPDCELNESLIRGAAAALSRPLNPSSHVIISMRWAALEDQISHLIFGSALAYALNRSIKLEMRRYPLHKPQPPFLLKFRGLTPAPIDPPVFHRLRIARELYCKSQSDFEPDSPSVPILIRNFDDISALYGNHFVGRRLREMFGFHAALFLGHHFIDFSAFSKGIQKNTIGVEAKSFVRSRRMKHLKDPILIAGNITKAIRQIPDSENARILLLTNDTQIVKHIQKAFNQVEVLTEDWAGLARLIGAKHFVGTYRSKLSVHVNTFRARPGILVNTDTGDVLELSNSQAGILSPYLQDVEDVEFTVNERLRGCMDNIDDLRDVLQRFVL